jgi:hypothetical protein
MAAGNPNGNIGILACWSGGLVLFWPFNLAAWLYFGDGLTRTPHWPIFSPLPVAMQHSPGFWRKRGQNRIKPAFMRIFFALYPDGE